MRDLELPGRSPTYAPNGIAVASNPLAALVAVSVLQEGGNAVDAAVAAGAVISVIEPYNMGLGADFFALYAPAAREEVIAYNGSGWAPAAATPSALRELGLSESIPAQSAHAVTVPGAVDTWCRLLADFGTRSLGELLAPAIRYASEGYPIHDVISYYWCRAESRLTLDPNAAADYLVDGRAPSRGSRHCQRKTAATMARLAREGRAPFYEGDIAEEIVAHLRRHGGLHTLEDFQAYAGEYVTPLSTNYRGWQINECPPNGQGIAALIMLNIFSGVDYFSGLDPIGQERLHIEIEAGKLAYRDRDRLIGDPRQEEVPISELLSAAHADGLRAHISRENILPDVSASSFPRHTDTSHLCVIDRDLNAISYIGSLFHVFGSGLVTPKSGIALQNRGHGFRLHDGHPNAVGPHKRPLHTIIPGMACRDGEAVMPFGVVGGPYQPFGHAHVLSNIIDFGLDLQEAIDVGRVFPEGDLVDVERGIGDRTALDLAALGHRVVRRHEGPNRDEGPIGGAQFAMIDRQRCMLIGAADARTDGCALGY